MNYRLLAEAFDGGNAVNLGFFEAGAPAARQIFGSNKNKINRAGLAFGPDGDEVYTPSPRRSEVQRGQP